MTLPGSQGGGRAGHPAAPEALRFPPAADWLQLPGPCACLSCRATAPGARRPLQELTLARCEYRLPPLPPGALAQLTRLRCSQGQCVLAEPPPTSAVLAPHPFSPTHLTPQCAHSHPLLPPMLQDQRQRGAHEAAPLLVHAARPAGAAAGPATSASSCAACRGPLLAPSPRSTAYITTPS